MTMPHLENCRHSEDGWCLDCVNELGEENIILSGLCGSESECGKWMYHGGDMPSYDVLAATVIRHIREWLRDKLDGMDILASTDLDNAIELLSAMRDV